MDELVRRLEAAVTRLEGLTKGHDDHELRLRALEQYKWKLIGVASAAAAALGVLLRFL